MPDEIEFRTKPQIALEQIDRALSNGVRVSAWTFDELYGRDGKFLDGLESRRQVFVGEIPTNFHGSSQLCCEPVRKRRENAGVRRNIRVWRVVGLRAKSATC